jgi:hypothetical protein
MDWKTIEDNFGDKVDKELIAKMKLKGDSPAALLKALQAEQRENMKKAMEKIQALHAGEADGGGKEAREFKQTALAKIEGELKAAQLKIKEALDRIKEQYEDHEISISEYYSQLTKLTVQSINLEIEALNKKLEVEDDLSNREKILSQIEQAHIRIKSESLKIDRERVKALKDLQSTMTSLAIENEKLKGNEANASMMEFAEKYKDTLKALYREQFALNELNKQGNLDDDGKAYLDQINQSLQIIPQIAKQQFISLRLKEEEANRTVLLNNLEIERYRLNRNVINGVQTELEAKEELYKLENKYADELEANVNKQIELAKQLSNPQERNERLNHLQQVKQGIDSIRHSMTPLYEGFRNTFSDGLRSSLTDIISLTKDADEAFKDMGKNIVRYMADVVSDKLTQEFMNLLFPQGSMVNSGNQGLFGSMLNGSSMAQFNTQMNAYLTTIQTSAQSLPVSIETVKIALDNLALKFNQVSGYTPGQLGQVTTIGTKVNSPAEEKAEQDKKLTKTTQEVNNGMNQMSSIAIPQLLTAVAMFSNALPPAVRGIIMLVNAIKMFEAINAAKDGGGILSAIGGFFGLKFADGGLVRGSGTSTSDSNLAALSDGEFVIRAAAVKKFGPGLFEALNRGRLPSLQGYANGGLVGGRGGSGGNIVQLTPVFAPTLQSLDPKENMRLLDEQYGVYLNRLIDDLERHAGLRQTVKGVVIP